MRRIYEHTLQAPEQGHAGHLILSVDEDGSLVVAVRQHGGNVAGESVVVPASEAPAIHKAIMLSFAKAPVSKSPAVVASGPVAKQDNPTED